MQNLNFDEIFFTANYSKVGAVFLHPWKSHAQNGKSDSTHMVLTLVILLALQRKQMKCVKTSQNFNLLLRPRWQITH